MPNRPPGFSTDRVYLRVGFLGEESNLMVRSHGNTLA